MFTKKLFFFFLVDQLIRVCFLWRCHMREAEAEDKGRAAQIGSVFIFHRFLFVCWLNVFLWFLSSPTLQKQLHCLPYCLQVQTDLNWSSFHCYIKVCTHYLLCICMHDRYQYLQLVDIKVHKFSIYIYISTVQMVYVLTVRIGSVHISLQLLIKKLVITKK